MDLDVNKLVSDIKEATSAIIKTDVATAKGFSERQVKGIADQASTVAKGILSGEITPATRQFFLDQLVELSKGYARTLIGLAVVTFERLWNKVVTIVWDSISKIVGFTLPPVA
jgi:hypothetical protein